MWFLLPTEISGHGFDPPIVVDMMAVMMMMTTFGYTTCRQEGVAGGRAGHSVYTLLCGTWKLRGNEHHPPATKGMEGNAGT